APLVRRADTGRTARHDLSALDGDELPEQAVVLVINRVNFFHAEFADLFAPEIFAAAFTASGTSRARTTIAVAAAVGWTFRGTLGAFAGAGGTFSGCCSSFVSHGTPSFSFLKLRASSPVGLRTASDTPAAPSKLLCRNSSSFAARFRGSRRWWGLALRFAELLDLVQALLRLVNAHGQELDNGFRYAQAAFQFMHERTAAFHGKQNVNTIMKFANGVSEAALAHTFDLMHAASR